MPIENIMAVQGLLSRDHDDELFQPEKPSKPYKFASKEDELEARNELLALFVKFRDDYGADDVEAREALLAIIEKDDRLLTVMLRLAFDETIKRNPKLRRHFAKIEHQKKRKQAGGS